jgi:hypothetical protein
VDRARLAALVFHRDRDASPDGGAVGLHAGELQVDPVVAVPWILEEAQRVGIARRGAAHLEHDLLVAIVIEIGERDAMALVQLPGAGRGRDVDERFPVLVAQQHARDE